MGGTYRRRMPRQRHPLLPRVRGLQGRRGREGLGVTKKKPHIVTESMREFSKDRYGVDVLKVEVPVNMKFVEGAKSFAGQKAYSKKEAIHHFHTAANVATKPFIY